MMANFQLHRRLVSLLLLGGIAVGGCAGLATSPSPALQQQIETARTRADHEALVKYDTGEAATARAKVVEHREGRNMNRRQLLNSSAALAARRAPAPARWLH